MKTSIPIFQLKLRTHLITSIVYFLDVLQRERASILYRQDVVEVVILTWWCVEVIFAHSLSRLIFKFWLIGSSTQIQKVGNLSNYAFRVALSRHSVNTTKSIFLELFLCSPQRSSPAVRNMMMNYSYHGLCLLLTKIWKP